MKNHDFAGQEKMKKTLKIIFQNKALFIGVILFINGLFSFGVKSGCDSFVRNGLITLKDKCIDQFYYSYTGGSIAMLTIGSLFLMFGILNIIRKD